MSKISFKKSDLIKEIKLTLYSPEKIEKNSFGKIISPKTFTKSWREELGGLFDPRVFGPSSDYECYCGKYQGIKNKNQKCDQCGVLVTSNRVRRWRMGHIELNAPVTNILFLKGVTSRISKIVEISSEDIESIVYCDKYVVIDKGSSSVIENKQILDKKIDYSILSEIINEIIESGTFSSKEKKLKEARDLLRNLDDNNQGNQKSLEFRIVFVEDYLDFIKENWGVRIETGSRALYEILKSIDLKKEFENLKKIKEKSQLKKNSSSSDSINERIRMLRSLIENNIKLENMVISKLPVIPSGIRPATKLEDDNSIATTQINNLYRGVILANNRLQSYKELNSKKEGKIFFADIIHNEMRRLQKSVDKLLHGGNQGKNDDLSVKSLIQMLSGKEGIPRKHSLGKRVDYSARSVIVPNPSLKIDQVGIPVKIALSLFKPFLIREIFDREVATNIKEANLIIKREEKIVFSILYDISKDHPVILNRAPTLHKLGIQSFYPILTLGKAIQLHPLVTTAFNADFDGDQMAIHLPLTKESVDEAKQRIIASKNILNPQNNNLIDVPTQDMILGIYYLTCEIKKQKVKTYYSISDLSRDYENQVTDVREIVIVPANILGKNFSQCSDKLVATTFGKILINKSLPESFPDYINDLKFYNENNFISERGVFSLRQKFSFEKDVEGINPLDGWKKKQIIYFLNKLPNFCDLESISVFLDELKDIGFEFSTKSGLTISLFDIQKLDTKNLHCSNAHKKVSQIDEFKDKGFYTDQESYEKKIEVWSECKDNIEEELLSKLKKSQDSSLYSIWNSEARASTENLMQIFAMRGNMTNYRGEIIETAITSSLWEGLTQFEFVISVYGMIKGMIDIAVKTAVAGHFSRMLVECVQNIIVSDEDCESKEGTLIKELSEFDSITGRQIVIIPLEKRIYGRFLSNDLFDKDGCLLIKRDQLILDEQIQIIKINDIKNVSIRTTFECNLFPSVCRKCYGLDLSKIREVVNLGSAVGITAAHSLGEPGTQLTMRTFHSGGVAGQQGDIVQGLPKVKEILENLSPPKEKKAVIAKFSGFIKNIKVDEKSDFLEVVQENDSLVNVYPISSSKNLVVKQGMFVERGELIASGKIDLNEYLEICGRDISQEYMKKEIWKVYGSQGIDINEKHIEMFIRQMISKLEVLEDFDNYLSGDLINYNDFKEVNKRRKSSGLKEIKVKQVLFGIKKITSYFPSFLSSISFQNTSKSLIEYVISSPVDKLEGIKENMIIGQMVPVGTGYEARKKWADQE